MNYITSFLPKTPEYLSGALEGALPHVALLTPKTLFRFTKYGIFDLTDIAIRFYRNIPDRNISWIKWSAKSTLLTATVLRLLNFCNIIPKNLELSINVFMVFATLVSSFKSLSKCPALLKNVQSLSKQMFAKNITSATFYTTYAISKFMTFYAGFFTLYSAINDYNEFRLETGAACYDTSQFTQSPLIYDISY